MLLTSRVQLHIYLLNVVNRISFSSILQIWYVEVRISRSISESPLDLEITRVDCIIKSVYFQFFEESKIQWGALDKTLQLKILIFLLRLYLNVVLGMERLQYVPTTYLGRNKKKISIWIYVYLELWGCPLTVLRQWF